MTDQRQTPAREGIIRTALISMGVLTTVPVLALVDPTQLESYGVTDPDPIVLTLLQHRSVYQFLLGAALVWSAFRPGVRVPVALAAITSKGIALTLTVSRPEALAESNPVAMVFDPICLVLLTALLVDVAVGRRRLARESVAA